MSYLNSWWSVARPHFTVLDAHYTLTTQFHAAQLGQGGEGLVNVINPLMPVEERARLFTRKYKGRPPPPPPTRRPTTKQPTYFPPTVCADLFDAMYGAGYCASRKGNCKWHKDFKAKCRKTCNDCGDAPTAVRTPSTVSTGGSRHGPTQRPAQPPPRDSSHPFANMCTDTSAINSACPSPTGQPVPAQCSMTCAQTFMPWYGECMLTLTALNAQLHNGLTNFFLKCAASIRQNR